jgi:predicted transcriptional regulator
MPRGKSRAPDVLRECRKQTGPFSIHDIAKAVGCTAEAVSSVLSRAAKEGEFKHTGRRGEYVRLKVLEEDKRMAVGTLLEVVSYAPNGAYVLRAEDQSSYLARPIK